MTDTRPRIVFVTLSDDIGSERIVSEMGRQGAACAVLGRPGSLASLCRGVHHHDLPSRGGAWAAARALPRRLERLAADWSPDAVVPLDDLAAQRLRDLATVTRTSPELRGLLRTSLGDPDHYRPFAAGVASSSWRPPWASGHLASVRSPAWDPRSRPRGNWASPCC